MAPGLTQIPSYKHNERADLTKRSIPHMLLSDGSAHSMTPTPVATTLQTMPTISATERFAVTGHAIVTGGAGVLGLATCHALLEHGLSGLVIFDSNATNCQNQVKELQDRFPDRPVEIINVDVTDEECVANAVGIAITLMGSVNHLVCFSGIVGCVDALNMPASQWRRIIDVNTTGAFICAQAVAKKMVDRKIGGSITFIASISAHRVNYPQPQAAYNVSKTALLSFKSCLAAEWARYGIRTNTVSPGYMDTILNEGDGIAAARRIWTERNPSGRLGVPHELTGAIVLLASNASTYINGADITVDGGSVVF